MRSIRFQRTAPASCSIWVFCHLWEWVLRIFNWWEPLGTISIFKTINKFIFPILFKFSLTSFWNGYLENFKRIYIYVWSTFFGIQTLSGTNAMWYNFEIIWPKSQTHKMLVDVSLCTKNGKIVQRSTCAHASGLLPRTKYTTFLISFLHILEQCARINMHSISLHSA